MAINWSTIEGFREDMTAEERLNLLEARDDYGVIDPNASKYKAQFDKVSGELAQAKRDLKARMSEEEAQAAERAAAQEKLEKELAELRRERTLSQYKASLLAQGYDEKSADDFAKGILDGDMDSVFKTMKAVQTDMEKRVKTELLKGTPGAPAGEGSGGDDKTPDIIAAERIGKAKAENMKSANNILNMYTGGK